MGFKGSMNFLGKKWVDRVINIIKVSDRIIIIKV